MHQLEVLASTEHQSSESEAVHLAASTDMKTAVDVFSLPGQAWFATYLRAQCRGLLANSAFRGTIPNLSRPISDHNVSELLKLASHVFLLDGHAESSLHHMMLDLRDCKSLLSAPSRDPEANRLSQLDSAQLTLLFALLGITSMLYEPDIANAPPESFAIKSRQDQWGSFIQSSCFMSSTAPLDLDYAQEHPAVFLRQFGYILPLVQPSSELAELSTGPLHARNRDTLLSAPLFFFSHLRRLGQLQIVWTNTLGHHLDLDQQTRSLHLFALPSFCHFILTTDVDSLSGINSLYSKLMCVECDSVEKSRYSHISDLMREILQTYRLIFGQDTRAWSLTGNQLRKDLFRDSRKRIYPWTRHKPPLTEHDPLLLKLCLDPWQKHCDFFREVRIRDAELCYNAQVDFPHLEQRLLALQRFMSEVEPTNIGSLWRDRRDALRFWTLWAVIILGGLSVLTGFWQAAVSTAALAYQIKGTRR